MLTRVGIAILLFSSAAAVGAQNVRAPVQAPSGGTSYLVFLQQRPVGREEVTLLNDADGWTVRGSNQLGPPIDVTTRRAEIRYDAAWNARSLVLEGIARGQDVQLHITFADGMATSEISVQGKTERKVDPVAPTPSSCPPRSWARTPCWPTDCRASARALS